MKRKILGRVVTVMAALAVFAALPFAFTQEAQAATEKEFYVMTSNTYKDGPDWIITTTYTRDSNGLIITAENKNIKRVFTRNSKGYVTSRTNYDPEGGPGDTYIYKYTYNKKGLAAKEKSYHKLRNGKKELRQTRTFTYYSNGKVKKMVLKRSGDDYSETTVYRKNGTKKSTLYKDPLTSDESVTYDKHGNIKTLKYRGVTYKHTLKYDKKGNLIKEVYKHPLGGTMTEKYKYTYDEHNNIIKAVNTSTEKVSGKTYKESCTDFYEYEPVMIAKEFWRFVKGGPFDIEEYY